MEYPLEALACRVCFLPINIPLTPAQSNACYKLGWSWPKLSLTLSDYRNYIAVLHNSSNSSNRPSSAHPTRSKLAGISNATFCPEQSDGEEHQDSHCGNKELRS